MKLNMYNHKFIYIFAIISGLGGFCTCLITCKSPSNRIVDWFIMYKVPKLSMYKTKGSEYFYMDSNTQTFSLATHSIQGITANPIFKTLLPLYSKSNTLKKYGMYNDQPPTGNAGSHKGHSKGAFAFGDISGFWFISSVPRFPAAVPKRKKKKVENSYVYKDSQTKKGQIMFCVTLESKHMETLSTAFLLTNPYIYDSKNLELPKKGNLSTFSISFKTFHNISLLRLFAKSSSFGQDLYWDLIQKDFGGSLFVQTWQPNLFSDKMITNVKTVFFENVLTYKTSLDHSKWAVAKQKAWTCIGDINRSDTQCKRGGLALCLYNPNVAKEFRKLVKGRKDTPKLAKRSVCFNHQEAEENDKNQDKKCSK